MGKMGAALDVKDGYARNFLIPRGIAYPATHKYERMLQEDKRIYQKREAHKHKGAQELADLLSNTAVTAQRKSGEEGRLFGSVTSQDIADLLTEKGVEIDKRKIVLDEPIRLLGTYQVRVHLHEDINALVQVLVVRDEGEEEKK